MSGGKGREGGRSQGLLSSGDVPRSDIGCGRSPVTYTMCI